MKKYLLLMWVFLFFGFYSLHAQINVTFKVDMSRWQEIGKFNPAVDEVKCVGDVSPNGWDPAANTGMTRTGGSGADSSVYYITYQVNPNASFAYKYAIGSDWNRDEKDLGGDGNRHLVTGSNDTTLATVWFDNISGAFKHVTFQVDMTLPIKQGDVIPGVTNVYIAGSFTDWGTNARLMTKSDTDDSLYYYTTLVPDDTVRSGDNIYFKYVYSAGSASPSGTWESPQNSNPDNNRIYFVPEQDSSEFFAYWSDVNPNVTLATGDINFTVDMSVMSEIGIFDPAQDSLLISAGFNGWTTNAPDARMTQNPINENSYFISQTFTNFAVGSDLPYKYFVKNVNPTGMDTIWTDGYERPVSTRGGNRIVTFAGDPSYDTTDYYDGVSPDWVVPSGTNLLVKFTVNMAPAMDPNLQGATLFNPATDSVFFISEQPTFRRSQGWAMPEDNHMSYFKLEPIGSDLYSGTLTLKEPTFNAFQYIYAFQKDDGTWWNEGISFGVESRVRYVGQDAPRSFPINPWTMPTDTWTKAELKPNDQETDPYTSYDNATGLKNESEQPIAYSLAQNYPNPFNPSTNIKFSIEKSGFVTLKVYNILGQEVATLLNKELGAGSYNYTFDASKLSSGIYLYSIQSGNFTQTKKMILMK